MNHVHFQTGMADNIYRHIPPIMREIAELPENLNDLPLFSSDYCKSGMERDSGIYLHENKEGGISIVALRKTIPIVRSVFRRFQIALRGGIKDGDKNLNVREFKFVNGTPLRSCLSWYGGLDINWDAAERDPVGSSILLDYKIQLTAITLRKEMSLLHQIQAGNQDPQLPPEPAWGPNHPEYQLQKRVEDQISQL
ncbi:MAG: hypothetical protein KGJ02_01660 [Verrucomicrobiota bacterium]|nr:hypothetical protein [Verrucomicrobiota bacterium]